MVISINNILIEIFLLIIIAASDYLDFLGKVVDNCY